MFGKQKCKALKEIRKQIADANDIPYVVSKCTYRGECNGTCPRCEEELLYLEKELEKRRKMGLAIVVAGISIGVLATAVEIIDAQYENVDITHPYEGKYHGVVTSALTGNYNEDE